MSRRLPRLVLRLAAESLVVIFSVWAAFLLEEWRDSRAAFRLETAQLAAIRDDVLQNQARLNDVIQGQRRVVEASDILVSIHGAGLPMPPRDSVADLVRLASSWFRLEPVTAAYDAMVSSGDVTRLRSRALLGQLASFAGDLTADFEDQAQSMDLLAEMTRIQMEHGLSVFSQGFLRRRYDIDAPPTDDAVEVLARDPRHAYLVAWRGLLERNRLEMFDQLSEAMVSLLAILDDELAQRVRVRGDR
jgi:hypothetical protein